MKNDHEDDDNDDCDYDENDDEVVILKEWGWENVAATKLSVKYQNIGRLRFAIAEKNNCLFQSSNHICFLSKNLINLQIHCNHCTGESLFLILCVTLCVFAKYLLLDVLLYAFSVHLPKQSIFHISRTCMASHQYVRVLCVISNGHL